MGQQGECWTHSLETKVGPQSECWRRDAGKSLILLSVFIPPDTPLLIQCQSSTIGGLGGGGAGYGNIRKKG